MVAVSERPRYSSQLTLFPYQEEAVKKMLALDGRGGLFMDRRTGKTRTALRTAQLLNCQRILVVCPLTAVKGWRKETALFPGYKMVNATERGVPQRAEKIKEAGLLSQVVMLVSWEAYWRRPLRTQIEKQAQAGRIDMVIYDEGHRLQSPTSKQSRFAHWLEPRTEHVLVLTGTPFAGRRHHAYSIYKAMRPQTFSETPTWTEYKHRYCRMGGPNGQIIIGYWHAEEIDRKIALTAFHVSKEDAWPFIPKTLPPEIIPITLSDKSRKVYDKIRTQALAEISGTDENGRPYEGKALARVVVTAWLRFQQITSGIIKADDGTTVDIGHEKLSALGEMLPDILDQEGKTVIFARFRRDLVRIRELAERYAPVFAIDGSVKDKGIPEEQFHESERGVAVVQVKATEGLDLSSSPSAIYYSMDFSLRNYQQSRDRLHNPGRREVLTYYYLLCPQTVDMKVFRALFKGESLEKAILSACKTPTVAEKLL